MDGKRKILKKNYDPIAMEKFEQGYGKMGVHLCENAEQVVEDCDAVVLVTEWSDYRDLDWETLVKKMRSPLILDGRHTLDKEKLVRAGMRYVSIS